MKIFLITASADDVRWATAHGLVDAVMTSPALLTAEGGDTEGRQLLSDIARLAGLPVHATAEAVSSEDVYHDGKELARLGEQIVVHIPMIEDALDPIRRLSTEGVRVTAAFVFGAAQALLAAKAGAAAVAVAIDQLDANGLDGIEIVREIRAAFDADGTDCDVVATHPRDATQFTHCALAGADAVALTPAVLKSLLVHPLTDRAVDQLLQDLSRRPRHPVGA